MGDFNQLIVPYLNQRNVHKLFGVRLALYCTIATIMLIIIIIMLSAYIALFHVFMLKVLYIITLALGVQSSIGKNKFSSTLFKHSLT